MLKGLRMRKIAFFVVMFLSVLNASKLTDMVERQAGQKVSVIKEFDLAQDSNLKFVVLKDEASGLKIPVITNKNESILIGVTQAFFTTNDADRENIIYEVNSVNNYNMTYKTSSEVKKAINTLPKDYIITLKGKNPKKTFYIVSDPMCPHCQVELESIDKRLANGNVKMIVVGFINEDSINKAAEIYKAAKTLKSDSEKIALLKKVYSKTYKAKSPADSDKKVVQDVNRALLGKGKVEGTPYIIEEDE